MATVGLVARRLGGSPVGSYSALLRQEMVASWLKWARSGCGARRAVLDATSGYLRPRIDIDVIEDQQAPIRIGDEGHGALVADRVPAG